MKRRLVHRMDRAISALYKNIRNFFFELIKSSSKHPVKCQLKSTLLDDSTDGIAYVGCLFRFSEPFEAEDCTAQKCKICFFLINLLCPIMISIRTVFVEPGAAPPVNENTSGTKLLRSTSKILCLYFHALTLS